MQGQNRVYFAIFGHILRVFSICSLLILTYALYLTLEGNPPCTEYLVKIWSRNFNLFHKHTLCFPFLGYLWGFFWLCPQSPLKYILNFAPTSSPLGRESSLKIWSHNSMLFWNYFLNFFFVDFQISEAWEERGAREPQNLHFKKLDRSDFDKSWQNVLF